MKIAIVSESTKYTAARLALDVQAIGKQLTHDVAPAWGLVPPTVVFCATIKDVPADAFPLVVLDHAD